MIVGEKITGPTTETPTPAPGNFVACECLKLFEFYIKILVCMLLIHLNTLTSEPTIDCEWNEWQIGGCTASCGKGYRTKSRTKKVEEANGGTCDGESTEHELCTSAPCPSKLSKLSIIDMYYTFSFPNLMQSLYIVNLVTPFGS